MAHTREGYGPPRPLRLFVLVLAVALAPALGACEGLLDVDNPNSLTSEDVEAPASARALANGALSSLSSAAGTVLRSHGVVADEFTRIGTHDFYDPLDAGNLNDPTNTLVNGPFGAAAEARWLSDYAIDVLGEQVSAGEASSRRPLARAYLYGGLAYVLIADHFEDFAFSDRTEAAPPIGRENMGQLYDQAISYFDEGQALAEQLGEDQLVTRFLAVRARARHARAVQERLRTGVASNDPLVDDAQLVADAEAALARIGGANDWRFQYEYSASSVTNTVGSTVNERGEIMWQTDYVVDPHSDDASDRTTVTLEDPIDGIPDPLLSDNIDRFMTGDGYAPITVVSAIELRLILAEAALARGDTAEFSRQINHVRGAYEELSPFEGQVDPIDLLKHERRVGLIVQGRRLHDHYRFEEPSSNWGASSHAVQNPGALFPMGDRERRTNCYILGTC